MFLDTDLLKQLSYFAFYLGAGIIAALWLSLVFWTGRDIRTRTKNIFAQILSVMLVLALFLPGLLIYVILRPTRTLEWKYQRALEEEALLQAIEEAYTCPGCKQPVDKEWLICPACHAKLKISCAHCGHSIKPSWDICPVCETPTGVAPVKPVSPSISSIDGEKSNE